MAWRCTAVLSPTLPSHKAPAFQGTGGKGCGPWSTKPAFVSSLDSCVVSGRLLPSQCPCLLICEMGVIIVLPDRFVMKSERVSRHET